MDCSTVVKMMGRKGNGKSEIEMYRTAANDEEGWEAHFSSA